MNKRILITALLFSAVYANAQTVADGLLYTQQDSYGTARFRSMSGAFGALGGDLSAVGLNPAGSVVFANHYASFSLVNYNRSNDNVYGGSLTTSTRNSLGLNQAGGVLIFNNRNQKAAVKKFSLGLNYDATNSLTDRLSFNGTQNTSLSDYFLGLANGTTLDNFQLQSNESVTSLYRFLGEDQGFRAQQGFLGYQSFLIDAVNNNDPNNTAYISNTGTGSFNQRNNINSTGFNGKVTFNTALNINDKINLGLNLNSHSLSYQSINSFTESNANTNATVSQAQFTNRLDVTGSGFSLQLGAIAKITDALRIGATYESPTWYTINESIIQDIRTVRNDGGSIVNEIIAPDIVNVFAPYDLKSPGSFTGSLAYIFGKKGLISIDYNVKDYSTLKFSPANDAVFSTNNTIITNELDVAATLRIGGEYRVDNWSLRAGYRNEGSPFKDKNIRSDINGYSLGLGYTWGNTLLDISYDTSDRTLNQAGFVAVGNTSNTNSNITLTLGFNL